MKYILPVAVFLLMLSVGASLRPGELLKNWRRLTGGGWIRLWLATFVIPPALVLALTFLLPLRPAEFFGLYLVAIAPGAPLLSRTMEQKGFDLQQAASYQVWGAFLTPVMIPVMLWVLGRIYGRDLWVEPWGIAQQIAEQQFLPFVLGFLLARFIPGWREKIQPWLVKVGTLMILAGVVLLLIGLGPKVKEIGLWSAAASVVLAAGVIAAMRWLKPAEDGMEVTFSLCNANRHVGLAVLLAGKEFHAKGALPAIASYALAAILVMTLYVMWRDRKRVPAAAQA
jgi:BASS family bile acid:Na+ symporter